ERGDHGLARADVALHETQHRHGPGEIVEDLDRDPPLRAGQCEWQAFGETAAQAPIPRQGRRRVAAYLFALALEAEMMGEQFLEREALAGGMRTQREFG